MATQQKPVKTAPDAAHCSQKHVAVQATDMVQFNMDKQTFTNMCHECQTPFGAKAAR